jgi:2-oxoglutarate ferredoxin oxidoreductase subunit alpha
MMDKRLRKIEAARGVMKAPTLYGPKKAETTFVAWGSSYGPVRETVDRLKEKGEKANFLHFTDIWPFPEDKVLPLLSSVKRLVNVESNGTGQFASLLRATTGRQVDHNILRYDGRPLSPEYILERL